MKPDTRRRPLSRNARMTLAAIEKLGRIEPRSAGVPTLAIHTETEQSIGEVLAMVEYLHLDGLVTVRYEEGGPERGFRNFLCARITDAGQKVLFS